MGNGDFDELYPTETKKEVKKKKGKVLKTTDLKFEEKEEPKEEISEEPIEAEEIPTSVKTILLNNLSEIDALALSWNSGKFKRQRKIIEECKKLLEEL